MSRGRKRPTPRPDATAELTPGSQTDLPPWPELPDLEQRLAELVSQIPSGRVATYGALALALGSIKASPWIATVLDRARFADLPTHRVVAATGQVRRGHPGQGLSPAEKLLAEGILFRHGKVLLEHSLWQPVAVSPPLQPLSAYQSACADWLRQQTPPGAKLRSPIAPVTSPAPSAYRHVAGLDVSYARSDLAVAACVIIDRLDPQSPPRVFLARCPVAFPYLSTFLSFREIPAMRAALQTAREAGEQIDLLLVDGTGGLHPKQVGIATQLGLLERLPSVGVTKSRLTGQWNPRLLSASSPQPIRLEELVAGYALQTVKGKTLYVSPGYQMQPEEARDIVQSLLTETPLPRPIYWADRLSRQHARQLQRG